MSHQNFPDISLAGPCGIYCGHCRHYLAREKGLLKEKNLKHGCKGCRAQDKNCAWVKRDCVLIRKKQIIFCFECSDFPCGNHLKLHERHLGEDKQDLVGNLLRIKNIGAVRWLKEQEEEWRCPQCGGSLCITDRDCYDCGYKMD
jgi:hypothetical protein